MCYDACCSNEQFNHQACLFGLEDPASKKVALARIGFQIRGVLEISGPMWPGSSAMLFVSATD